MQGLEKPTLQQPLLGTAFQKGSQKLNGPWPVAFVSDDQAKPDQWSNGGNIFPS